MALTMNGLGMVNALAAHFIYRFCVHVAVQGYVCYSPIAGMAECNSCVKKRVARIRSSLMCFQNSFFGDAPLDAVSGDPPQFWQGDRVKRHKVRTNGSKTLELALMSTTQNAESNQKYAN